MEKMDERIEVLEQLVEDLILKLGRANHRIYKNTQRIASIEYEFLHTRKKMQKQKWFYFSRILPER